MPQYTFLVTGASSGLELHISLQALQSGHSVLGTARNPEKAAKEHPEFEQLGGLWQILDVTDPKAQSIVEKVVRDNGVNVLVNNAGYSLLGSLEDTR
jgi:short-subunit dehydrogenase